MSVSGTVATSVGYYLGGGAASGPVGYYIEKAAPAEPKGQWRGKFAEDLELEGDVEADVMEPLYGEWVTPDGTKLGRQGPASKGVFRPVQVQMDEWLTKNPDAMPEDIESARRSIEANSRNANLGVDLTYSLPKSASITHAALWRAELNAENAGRLDRAAGRLDRAQSHFDRAGAYKADRVAIEEAASIANQAMADFAEELAVSQMGRHGATGVAEKWIGIDGTVRAEFFQHTNRSIQPQLHTHNVFLNRAKCADGEIRALDTVDLLAQRHALGALADRVFMETLSARGVEFEMRSDGRERPAWEIKGVDRELIEVCSERSMTIRGKFKAELERVEREEGRELTDTERWRLKQELTLSTRARKTGKVPDTMTVLKKIQTEIKGTLNRSLQPLAESTHRAMSRGSVDAPEAVVSFDRICSEAVAALSEKNPTWRWSDLYLEIEQRTPHLGGHMKPTEIKQMFTRLTDRTIDDPRLVTQTAGREGIDVPLELGGPGVYVAPADRRYSSTGSVAAEQALRDAAAGRGGHHIKGSAVDKWLDSHDRYRTVTPDQRAVIVGLAKSDARIAVLSAPAGTGKSFTMGAFAEAWADLSGGGRVIGLAPSERAAQVLEDAGLQVTANVDRFLAAQKRLQAGKGLPLDSQFKVGPKDIVIVDESSMVSRRHLEEINEIREAKGARVIPVGDPEQMAAVQAGGVLGLLDGHCETYGLTEVRRFQEEWEAAASIRLRAGDVSVLEEYDRRGRIVDCKDAETALERAARDAAADLLFRDEAHPNGFDSMVVTRTNPQASAASAAIREQLVRAGEVKPELGEAALVEHDGMAAVGDRVACRENDYRLGLTNRRVYTVVEVHEDGGISVMPNSTMEVIRVPQSYVSEHVSLAYAGTVHATQGVTLDRSRAVFDGQETRAGAYVPMTRGAELNMAYVSLGEKDRDPSKAADEKEFWSTAAGAEEATKKTRITEFDKSREFNSGVQVLEGVLRREGEANDAALVWLDRDDARLKSMSTLLGWREDAIHTAQMGLINGWFDELASLGLLSEDDRGRLAADQGVGHLAHLLRAADQAGEDPKAMLTAAVLDGRGFTTKSGHPVDSIARVLSVRIESTYRQARDQKVADTVPSESRIPAGLSAQMERHLERIDEAIDNRRRELGSQVATEKPVWAVRAFGPLPEEPTARLGWEHRAGMVAGYREAAGFQDERRPIGDGHGVSSTERRALWHDAYTALGRPESRRTEAAMSDAQLRVRVQAWRREQEWAPKHANAALKEASRSQDEAHVANVLEGGERLENQEEVAALGAEAEARDAWWAETAETRSAAGRADEELEDRGLSIDDVPGDLVTPSEWLAAQQEADRAEDPHRVVTEVDVVDEVRDQTLAGGVEERALVSEPAPDVDRRWAEFVASGVDVPVEESAALAAVTALSTPDRGERDAAYDRAAAVADEIADRESLEESAGAVAIYDLPYDLAPEETAVDETAGQELVAEL